ncbi:MAG: hypothetical protein QOF87_2154 [Pseudonocardiales bacterium]|jgi:hypothetical protein|nr:hypothetical protein [Pseudonocardiales bacterium]MDT4907761.1 hypothetical protein [Pseudonocardiales bacterium]MDT4956845.1 hypothetical protein [Pseudonocardiales bacterium]MDT4962507.1 hypothetical protein [Pseudonocardiales bacterium]MDT4970678.1 hypothetical protein [Pseudonocardiales bacterium]
MVATATKPTASPTFEVPSFEDATGKIKDLNEKFIESSKSAGLATLDAYEKAVAALVDVEDKVASASQVEWVSTLATTHAKFITDLSTSYAKAARGLLK